MLGQVFVYEDFQRKISMLNTRLVFFLEDCG